MAAPRRAADRARDLPPSARAAAHLNATGGFRGFVEQVGDMMCTVGREARPDYPRDDALVERIEGYSGDTVPIKVIPFYEAVTS